MRGALLMVLAACHKDPPPAPAPPPPNVPITATTLPAEAFGSGEHAQERKGTLPLTPPMQFALLGADGSFDEEADMVVFDLNRDGKLDTSSLDADELLRNFEKTVTIDGKDYAFSPAKDGSSLTLAPLGKKLPPRTSLRAGSPAPDFTATTLEGTTVKLSELRGKPVVLDFWSKTCLPCLRSMPIVEEVAAKGVEIVSIADPEGGDPTELVKGHPGHHVVDYGGIMTTYRIDRFPTYFLVDKTGAIACARCPFPKIQDALQ
jgi:thiol-disulfide isomerase/thioredoxin